MPKGMTSKTIVRSVDLDEIERQLREIAKSAAQNQSKSRAAGRLDPLFAREVPLPQAVPEGEGRSARFPIDTVADVPDEGAAERPVARRRLRVPLMIAVPVLAIACGVGAVMAMRPNILSINLLATSGGETPAAAPSPVAAAPAPAAATKPADQPDQAAKADAGQGGAKPEAAREASLATSSPVTAPAVSVTTPIAPAPAVPTPVASTSIGSPSATATPAAAPAQASVVGVPQAAAQSAVFGKPHRVATISIKPAADAAAPAADPSQAAADTAALFGTPRRVTSFSVKPDGSVVPSQGSAPALAPKVASTDAKGQPTAAPAQATPTPAAKPHADTSRPKPKPSPAANRRQTGQAALSILPPAGGAAAPQDPPPQATQSAAQSSGSNPLAGVANGFHRVLEMTHIVGPADQSQ